jgi:hypothetical protein
MVKFQRILQRAKLHLNSQDAQKTEKIVTSIAVDGNPLAFDSASGTIIDTVNSIIYANNHQFFKGEAIVYSTTGTAIAPLQSTVTYYAIPQGDNAFRVASSAANANNDVFISLTGVGSGTHSFKRDVIFDGSDANVVDTDTGALFIQNSGFKDNDYVLYTRTGGSDIQGIVNNKFYYIFVPTDGVLVLLDDLKNNIPIARALAGTQHILRKIVEFNTTGSAVINTASEVFTITNHGFNTGDAVQYKIDAGNTAITPLLDNQIYYIIKQNNNSFKLALSPANVASGTAINITAFGVGNNHTFTKVNAVNTRTCTNYKFKIDEKFILNEKCKISLESFHYLDISNPANCNEFGGVYIRNISSSDTYNSQGNYNGHLLLSAHFGNNIIYNNYNLEYSSVQLPYNASQLLQNGLDIFIDTKIKDQNDADIKGALLEDQFTMSLIIYELEDYDYINVDLNEKIKNYNNTRLV